MPYQNFDDFDPNNPSTFKTLYGVWNGTSFKLYENLSAAMGRFNSQRRAKMFRLEPGADAWEYCGKSDPDGPKPAPVCEVCDGSTELPEREWNYNTQRFDYGTNLVDTGRGCWLRAKGKLVKPLRMIYTCRDCREREGLR